jgi:hypothetical protein
MYVKIFDSIIKSSVWDTDPETRITWITCLLLCDQNGNFTATRRYIAREANLPQDRVDAALDLLLAPDIDSTTPDECGRRLDYCGNNTWHVVNYQKYNELAKAETVREQTRARVRNFKQRAAAEPSVTTVTVTQGNAEVTQGNAPVTVGNEKVTPLTITVATPVTTDSSPTPSISPVPGDGEKKEVEPVESKKLKPEPVQLNRETLNLDNLTASRIESWTRDYPGVDIDEELAAINAWCKTATAKALKVKQWSRFIDNWLQKALADKAAGKRPKTAPQGKPRPVGVTDEDVAMFGDRFGNLPASIKLLRRMQHEQAEAAAAASTVEVLS